MFSWGEKLETLAMSAVSIPAELGMPGHRVHEAVRALCVSKLPLPQEGPASQCFFGQASPHCQELLKVQPGTGTAAAR